MGQEWQDLLPLRHRHRQCAVGDDRARKVRIQVATPRTLAVAVTSAYLDKGLGVRQVSDAVHVVGGEWCGPGWCGVQTHVTPVMVGRQGCRLHPAPCSRGRGPREHVCTGVGVVSGCGT